MTTYWLLGEKTTAQNENNSQQLHLSISTNQIPSISTSQYQNYGNDNKSLTSSNRNLDIHLTGNGAPPSHSPTNHRSTVSSTQITTTRQTISSNESLPNHAETGANSPLLLPVGSVPLERSPC